MSEESFSSSLPPEEVTVVETYWIEPYGLKDLDVDNRQPLKGKYQMDTEHAIGGKIVANIILGRRDRLAVVDIRRAPMRGLGSESYRTPFLYDNTRQFTGDFLIMNGLGINAPALELKKGETLLIGKENEELYRAFDLTVWVSRRHCSLTYTDSGFLFLQNLAPSNGTRVQVGGRI